MSSEIARLKSKFEQKKYGSHPSAPPPRATPAFFEMKQRELKQAQVNAAKAARQSAARYNLTVRALALSSAKKAQDERFRNMDSVQRAKELASHYNATKRALNVAVAGVTKKTTASAWPAPSSAKVKIQTKISEGDELASASPLSPASATMVEVPVDDKVDLVTEAAQCDEEPAKSDDDAPPVPEAKEIPFDKPAEVLAEEPAAETEVVTAQEPVIEKHESSEQKEEPADEEKTDEEQERKDGEQAFSLPELENALKAGDENAINEALVRTFLEEMDPERARDSARLLEEYRGKEEELMQTLLQEIPPTETEQTVPAEVLGMAASTADPDGAVGFVTSGVADSTTNAWKVTTVKDPQLDAFRTRLLAKGIDEQQIDKIMDDSSEML